MEITKEQLDVLYEIYCELETLGYDEMCDHVVNQEMIDLSYKIRHIVNEIEKDIEPIYLDRNSGKFQSISDDKIYDYVITGVGTGATFLTITSGELKLDGIVGYITDRYGNFYFHSWSGIDLKLKKIT